jgi:transglutaminase-like putative cysteine protease
MALWSALLSRPARTPLAVRPSLILFFLLAGAFLLTLVPHVVQFPLWVSVTVVGAMVLRSIIEVYRLPLPSTTFCGILAVVLLGLIMVQFGTVLGRDAGTAFTAGLLAIKFYELRGPRDVSLIIFSCFFMVMSSLLYSQVLELFIYCLIMMWVLTALLLRVHTGDLAQDRLLRMLGQSGIIFLQALPLALFLYFFFPRYTGKLSLALEEPTIGLTDTVAPGSIAKLAQNDSEAMYVQFAPGGNIPTTDTMYWRALVLWDYRNGIWTPGDLATLPSRANPPAAPDPDRISQEITIRPHNQRWLFALDVPVSVPINTAEAPSWAVFLNGGIVQLTNNAKLDHSARYAVLSSTTRAEEELTPDEKRSATRLPDDQIDQQVKDLADQLHQGLSDGRGQDYIRAVLRYFRHGGFVYSTAPGAQGTDWLPVFLFRTKTGFCEHFASAFAVLMRLKKIPARLVVGYQGADYNPYSDHYIVSQSNAHAWDEVWMPAGNRPDTGKMEIGRWVRVDPTALLAMAEEGQSSNNSADAGDTLSIQVAHHKPTFSQAWLPAWARDSLKEMQLRREQVETDWDNLVFSYDPEAQNRLAQALGFGEKAGFELLLVCLGAGGICLIIFQKWMARKPPVSPVENLYAVFCRHMARRGIPRAAWEGPLAYTQRVAEAFPDDKPAIQRVGSLVAHARYGPAPANPAAPHDLKSLLTVITAFQAASSSRERR